MPSNQYYLTARLVRDGQIVNAAVFVAESAGLEWQEPGVKQPIVIRLGQPVIGVDVISSTTSRLSAGGGQGA